MTLEPTRQINYYYGTNGGNGAPYQGINSSSMVTLDQWHHVVLVRNLTLGRVIWYFDGNVVSNTAANFGNATAGGLSTLIGNGYVSNFVGYLDEFVIYDSALPALEVTRHYSIATSGCE